MVVAFLVVVGVVAALAAVGVGDYQLRRRRERRVGAYADEPLRRRIWRYWSTRP